MKECPLCRQKVDNKSPESLTVGGVTINFGEVRVTRDGKEINLTHREYEILTVLMTNHRRPVSRATLVRKIWGVTYTGDTNIVDVYINYLRNKIDTNEFGLSRLIHTIRGFGYKFEKIDTREFDGIISTSKIISSEEIGKGGTKKLLDKSEFDDTNNTDNYEVTMRKLNELI